MDACHSGAVTGRGLDLTPMVKDMTSAEVGAVTFTGSTGREQSQESDQRRHGAFSLALIEGLTSRHHYRSGRDTRLPADANADGQIILEELAAFMVNRVTDLTQGAQHPTLQRGDVPSFTVAVVR